MGFDPMGMSSGQFGSVASNCTKTLQRKHLNFEVPFCQENLWKLRCLAPKDVRRSLHVHLCYVTYIYIITINQIYCVCCQPWIHKPQTAVLNGGGTGYRGWSLQEVADRHPKRFAFRQCETDSGAVLMWSIWCGRWCINYRIMCINIYICMCMYICICVCVCTYVYVYIYIYA